MLGHCGTGMASLTGPRYLRVVWNALTLILVGTGWCVSTRAAVNRQTDFRSKSAAV